MNEGFLPFMIGCGNISRFEVSCTKGDTIKKFYWFSKNNTRFAESELYANKGECLKKIGEWNKGKGLDNDDCEYSDTK